MQTSVIYQGDNLRILPDLDSGSVDLVYIDPPFNSGREYQDFWKEDKTPTEFSDQFANINEYIDRLRPRVQQLIRVLKPTGSFYFHCDTHANYRIRALLQEEFGLTFRSEIVWQRTAAHSDARRFGRVHDTILFFSKGKDYTWNKDRAFIPYDLRRLDPKTAKKYKHRDKDGRLYRLDNLTSPQKNRPNLNYEFLGVTRVYRWTKDRMQRAYEQGLVVQTAPRRVPQLKRYLDEQKGLPLSDVWTDIPPLNSQARERVGYPTQKPLALMHRILECSSKPGQVVLDAYCGCGTTIVAAAAMKRKWIGIDMSPTACNVVADRLFRDLKMKQDLDFIVRSKRMDMEALLRMDHWDFQNAALILVGGLSKQKRGADKGIDGHLYISNPDAPPEVQKTLIFGAITGKQANIFNDQIPVQVKQTKAGRPDVDNFQTALRRVRKRTGIIVALEFSKDAHQEVKRARDEDGVVIHLFTVGQLLEMQAA